MKTKLPTFLALLLAFGLNSGPAGLASTSSYYLDSSRLELQVSPNSDTASGVVKVSSNTNKPIRLKIIPKLWNLSPQGVLTYLEPPATGYNLLDNIGINPEEFELQPGKSRLVRFIVKVPHEAENAEYPFQLYFQPTSLLEAQATQQNTAGVSNVLDVIPVFTTTVYAYKGKPAPNVKVDSLKCNYLPDRKHFSVNLNVSNAGNKHARLFGNLVLSKKTPTGTGDILDVLHMQNSTLIVVFPGTPRVVENELASEKVSKLDPGDYQMELRLVDERNVQPAIQSVCEFSVPTY